MKTLSLTSSFLIFLAIASFSGAQAAESVDQKVATCAKSKAENGHMPWGATDKDLRSYKGKNLCTYNDGRPIGAQCRKTLAKLYKVGKEINTMVTEGCKKYVPMFFNNPEMIECKRHKTNCTPAASKELNELNAQIRVFKKKLDTFTGLMIEQQKYVMKSSEKVVDVLDENEKYRGSDRYNMPSPGARNMGVSTISESDALNNRQDAAYARNLWRELQNTFKDSEKRYADVTEENYREKLAPITESFKKVGALKSKVLREQLHGFLKAEELKLATKLYHKRLDGLETMSNQFIDINEQSQNDVTSISPNEAAAASTQVAYNPESGLPSLSQSSPASSGGLSFSSPASRAPASAVAEEEMAAVASASVAGTGNAAEIASTEGGDGDPSEISATSASMAPGSLRESLREKIAAKSKSQGGGADEEFEESGTGAAKLGADGSVAEGIRGENGHSPTDAEAQSPDGALAGFSGSLSREGAFSLSGPGGEDAVTELMTEFRNTLREQAAPLSAGVEGMNSASLFERIKEFHLRCLQRGCVVGVGKAGEL